MQLCRQVRENRNKLKQGKKNSDCLVCLCTITINLYVNEYQIYSSQLYTSQIVCVDAYPQNV